MRSQTVPWITKALEDFKSAHVLFDAGLTDPACFHSQQAAEKCLEAVLEEHKQQIPKTHDLDLLIDKFPQNIVPPKSVLLAASTLTSFAVDIRYPGTEADIEDARDSLGHAKVIMDWTMAMLSQIE